MDLNFEKTGGLIPAIIQDEQTGKVLMLGYMNEEAIAKTQETGKVTFFSRTKNRLWTKGETSGNFLMLKSMVADCDRDTLLVKADPVGPACHTGADTCFNEENTKGVSFLNQLGSVIKGRRENPSESSYTSKLFARGINKVAQKVGEEAVEVVIEAKDDNRNLFLNEAADLLFHLMVLLEAKDASLPEVVEVLEARHK
ncbi:bifunctional phosphoribosyl-AMP cyclohydrolase/phosphoribosyl-ATP diphosphatase HisIE [Pontibacter sp. G13]|uniref:bifunctional phosphoribosyl-AMP cyclohydrolase/phosphoribosyl-ATP diphosphatase HisIE n=1 Tax=Pontibacter sp. G13 TaxID=3074898 RepID=UPI00288ACED7|nr:bifunctional phosphoribosyl-AMP cyclohydrolase/phosphoribosyl-ATP diphosphatase HisIE [Pontibacter sp. G13]WNJ18729.1 bifunctional phosphoribosyl-AMP cyclohydrolase/phosphoribosyl-ATP diphosphatase HisIE [Pontibacter sp. G13]